MPFMSTRMVGGPSRIGLFSGRVTQTHSVCFISTDFYLADSQYSPLLSIRHRLRAILCGSSTCRNWLSDADRRLRNLCATSVTYRRIQIPGHGIKALYTATPASSAFSSMQAYQSPGGFSQAPFMPQYARHSTYGSQLQQPQNFRVPVKAPQILFLDSLHQVYKIEAA